MTEEGGGRRRGAGGAYRVVGEAWRGGPPQTIHGATVFSGSRGRRCTVAGTKAELRETVKSLKKCKKKRKENDNLYLDWDIKDFDIHFCDKKFCSI